MSFQIKFMIYLQHHLPELAQPWESHRTNFSHRSSLLFSPYFLLRYSIRQKFVCIFREENLFDRKDELYVLIQF